MSAPTRTVRVVRVPGRPWWAQRLARRDERRALFSYLVAGRQSGKSHYAALAVVRRAARAPGGQSLCLWPTYKHAAAPLLLLRRFAGMVKATWHEEDSYLLLPNGHRIWVRSTEREDAPRGLQVTTTLWVDEGALVSEGAWKVALGTLMAAETPLVLVTTTPAGRGGWLYRAWITEGAHEARGVFRSAESPVGNPAVKLALRARHTEAAASQELDAVFTDDARSPITPDLVAAVFARPLGAPRPGGWLGVDVAKEIDFVVLAFQAADGRTWLIDRWQHVAWPDTQRRIEVVAQRLDAEVWLDTHSGGGQGGTLHDYLARGPLGPGRVHGYGVGAPGGNQAVVECLIAEAEGGRLSVDPLGPVATQAQHELLMLQVTRRIVQGSERLRYHAPEGGEEHDDCVFALALATWGRVRGATSAGRGDYRGFGGHGGERPPRGRGAQDTGGFGGHAQAPLVRWT